MQNKPDTWWQVRMVEAQISTIVQMLVALMNLYRIRIDATGSDRLNHQSRLLPGIIVSVRNAHFTKAATRQADVRTAYNISAPHTCPAR